MPKTAYDISRKKVYFCSDKDLVPKVADTFQKNNIGSILVNNKYGKTVGIVTVGDILRLISKKPDFAETKAGEIMSSPIVSVHKDTPIDKLVNDFEKGKATRLVLTKDTGEYVGVVRDIAAFKYIAFVAFDKEAKERFGRTFFNRF